MNIFLQCPENISIDSGEVAGQGECLIFRERAHNNAYDSHTSPFQLYFAKEGDLLSDFKVFSTQQMRNQMAGTIEALVARYWVPEHTPEEILFQVRPHSIVNTRWELTNILVSSIALWYIPPLSKVISCAMGHKDAWSCKTAGDSIHENRL
jgi:hypothetical protein